MCFFDSVNANSSAISHLVIVKNGRRIKGLKIITQLVCLSSSIRCNNRELVMLEILAQENKTDYLSILLYNLYIEHNMYTSDIFHLKEVVSLDSAQLKLVTYECGI